ncbi:related to CDC33 - translation initiation factor eIF4E [Melanopsichium pennsylvanicum]|uniref:Related to CDC33 - translation initiation factor eIF4E n=2 Tax=Melanopsichium pennsylvanicum TaxID=63383 RepID=A0AAJ5C845_9BASI|nr:related to CDC33 - translation initiation factor eIF4E [Melanopsichium pennsylvanicum]
MPAASCSIQAATSPSSFGSHARSPSKLPTLRDISARLNRDRNTSVPSSSPTKQLSSGGIEAARPRLEPIGRITGSPKPLQLGEQKSPLLPPSPSKATCAEDKPDDSSLTCLSPKTLSSGSCSPTKRMLAKGLPRFEEIRDRMSRKGLTTVSDGTSPKIDSTPSSPGKFDSERLGKSPEIQKAAQSGSARVPADIQPQPEAQMETTLKVSTSSASVPKLTHPLPPTPSKAPTYLLQHEWTLFFDTRTAGPSTLGFTPDSSSSHAPPTPTLTTSSWEANLRTIGSFATVNNFLGCFSKLHRPSQLDRQSSYHVFKDGIKPMWEDPRNTNGGKWTITFRQRNLALIDRSWLWLVLGLIGEAMDEKDETCGAVCSVKPRGDRISLWIKDSTNVETVNSIGKKLLSLLELEKEPGISLEFSSHSDNADEAKLEGLFRISNPMQQMARTPTISTFGPAAGLPNADGAKRTAAGATGASYSPTSPIGKGFSRSPATASPNTEVFGRLAGQQSNGNLFGRSPGNASPNVGALGQSLGLGVGVNTSPSVSPNPNRRNPFQRGTGGDGALPWRSNRSSSPQHTQNDSISGNKGLLKLGTEGGDRSRTISPFKAEQ